MKRNLGTSNRWPMRFSLKCPLKVLRGMSQEHLPKDIPWRLILDVLGTIDRDVMGTLKRNIFQTCREPTFTGLKFPSCWEVELNESKILQELRHFFINRLMSWKVVNKTYLNESFLLILVLSGWKWVAFISTTSSKTICCLNFQS